MNPMRLLALAACSAMLLASGELQQKLDDALGQDRSQDVKVVALDLT